ncbi:hypothetical protein CSV71_07695 [Sporosarcina sp. P21c]|uniref:hypothetical protein n=1 Tax=Sporosarcina TaxID=1569 RepID=UPI000A14F503|nr:MULTISPECIES: hypothetical protein [Sporosarcina]ARJ38092.1 hypothetical protein SporoP8_03780 [Sporosarcina ureae]PIC66687.1 hypothetical protein CSV78_10915 [Sporosarcina sp. P16a]PIC89822.1 hypothetical protein CSV71_07695 [Sporosarcina sp. P21c]PIC93208.1 hypothetical protein CSV70_06510 [Sporosarcina sp. P25]
MRKLVVFVMIIVFLLIVPVGLWFLKDNQPMKVAIIDKSAVENLHTKHLGVSWVLNYSKVKASHNKPFDPARDYYGGYTAVEGKGISELNPLPQDYGKKDIIYLANTASFDENELDTKNSALATYEENHGGLKEIEWQRIVKRLNSKKPSMLIAEYNSFSAPTSEKVRTRVEDRMGLKFSGWRGRYMEELDPQKNAEMEKILPKQSAQWTYSGPGFVLMNDTSGEVLVLRKNEELSTDDIQLTFTDNGTKRLNVKGSHRFHSWFDIVTAEQGESLAVYDWNLTEKGKKMLDKKGIPTQFDAVIRHTSGVSESMYFSGDFSSMENVPSIYQVKGIANVYKAIQRSSEKAFFWSAYVPMMQGALAQFGQVEAMDEKKPKQEGVQMNSRMNGNHLEVLTDGKWTPMIVKGVNIGMGKPGAFPGEAAITEEEYYKWFEAIGEMNANTIRVYTLHPPDFYHALKAYNDVHDTPIYVMHGVWINEEKLEESLDAFEKENLKDFQKEMVQLVDVIHGNATVPPRPGHASGVYDADISQWVTAWMIGIEWYPFMVENTNKLHADLGEYNGKYFETKGAAAFEYWLAEQMDILVSHEVSNYQQIRPMSFVNWVTTDLLTHPSDSSNQEDIVSVDPNLLYTKGEMDKAGQFASYHVYPYYPDFLNYEKKYREFIDFRGQKNNYAGYLKDLHEAHRIPILISEFGIPASRGKAHENPFGWNQGFISEDQQGEILTHLYEDILQENLMGALVFSWQDEWFKRTWNTAEYDNPDRRPYWSNTQTNEQKFGLLSFDPLKIKVAGHEEEWTGEPLYKNKQGTLEKMYVDHDETFLYIRIDYDESKIGETDVVNILFDTVPGRGNTRASRIEDLQFTNGLEFIAKINGAQSRMLIDPHYDLFHHDYGKDVGYIPKKEMKDQTNQFIPMQYALNRKYFVANEKRTIPFSSYETGKLREGNGDPDSTEYDSLADYHMRDGMLELRIPWMLLQAMDPSRKEFIENLLADGTRTSINIDELFIGAVLTSEDGQVLESFPQLHDMKLDPMKSYTWDNWQVPMYEERLKKSYYYLQEAFKAK